MQFRDVLDLVPQSAVKVDDVSVGRVDDVELDGYTAEVTLLVRGDVELPDNAIAGIRQTSLLGEKFVDLAPPESRPQREPLEDGDTIELEDTGRNPEVEEVLGALSLFLNGGGVGQLKIVTEELNKALDGREGEVKSTLRRFATLMEGLDDGKAGIVRALENVNSLAISLNKETDTLDLALDELPVGHQVRRQPARGPRQDAAGAGAPQRRRHPGHPGLQAGHHRLAQRAGAGAHRAGEVRRRLRQQPPDRADLPLHRRRGRQEPAAGARPPHG